MRDIARRRQTRIGATDLDTSRPTDYQQATVPVPSQPPNDCNVTRQPTTQPHSHPSEERDKSTDIKARCVPDVTSGHQNGPTGPTN